MAKIETEMGRSALAKYLAVGIFQTGEDPRRPTARIQFKSGKWPDEEKDEGGLCLNALESTIRSLLQELEG